MTTENNGNCPTCQNTGMILFQKMINNIIVKQASGCHDCKKNHGYINYVKAKYSRSKAEICRIKDNLFGFPSELRGVMIIAEKARNNGIIPIKAEGDNVVNLADRRKREN